MSGNVPYLAATGPANGEPDRFRLRRFRRRTRVMLVKEFLQIRRTRSLIFILVAAPLFQLLIMGFAASTDIRGIYLAVRDGDRSRHSREYVRALESSGYFRVVPTGGDAGRDGDLLVSGRAGLALVLPPGFGSRLSSGRSAQVQVLVDGADSNFGVQGLSYLQRATRQHAEGLVRAMEADAVRRGWAPPRVIVESRAWFNPDLRSRLFMIPALMGVLLMVTTTVVTSMALVKEREEGTMEQLLVTPLRPAELMAGKLLPFVAIGFIEVTLALLLIRLVFGIPLRGSILDLYLVSGLFLLTTLGLGLLVSTLVRTQQQAMMTAAFFVLFPFVLLSGFIFPVENMPAAVQPIAKLIPLRYYLRIVRGLFLKGNGWTENWPDAAVLLGWGAGILSISILKFRKRLD